MATDMDMNINSSALSGIISAIPSKSHVHRLLICSALADSPSFIALKGSSSDIEATINCLSALGASIECKNNGLQISPINRQQSEKVFLDCGESGSTLRFLLPVTAALGKTAYFKGQGRLPERPLEPLISQLCEHNSIISNDHIPFTISGKLTGGHFALPGNISSQYITGLLMALPLIGGGTLEITTPLQSSKYVDMTISVMKQFGINITKAKNCYTVPDAIYHSPGMLTVQGDWSNAAPWLCAGAINGNISVTGLSLDNMQADSLVLDILRRFGADIFIENGIVKSSYHHLRGITIDAGAIPDLIPPLSVVAAAAQGETHIANAARLRIKESDRLSAICSNLSLLGADVIEGNDNIIIRGGHRLTGTVLSGYNDHRIVMSAVIASLITDGTITVSDSEAINKSYPGFFEDFKSLGGFVNV